MNHRPNMSELDIWSVSKLADYIKKTLYKKVKIKGEVSQPKISSGHLYFQLKDQHASIRGIIWKYNSTPKDSITDGQKLTVEGKLDFYGMTGSTNLIVDKIVTMDGEGELFAKYAQIKQEFTEKGYFDMERKKKLPSVIKHILLLTSETGAALQDFLYNLDNQHSNLTYDLVDVKVQGTECPHNICVALQKIQQNRYDVVVITRGGGSFEDLFGFSKPELIEAVYQCSLPVLSAIGHQVDSPLLDFIADCVAPTPSLAAQLIVDHNKSFIEELKEIQIQCKESLLDKIQEYQNQLGIFLERLYKNSMSVLQLRTELQNQMLQTIQQQLHQLCRMESVIQQKSSDSIRIFHNATEIKSPQELQLYKGKQLQLRWMDYESQILLQ
jgi:exodeoxyribonuclease VII large subunit